MNNPNELVSSIVKIENNTTNNIISSNSNSDNFLENTILIKKEPDPTQSVISTNTVAPAATTTTTTATTVAPYIIQNGNIYQLTSNNQLISRNSIQVNQVSNTGASTTTKLENVRQAININAPSLLNSNNLSLNIVNTKLTGSNNIKLTTLKNGTLLNINSLPNGCKNRIIFKTPITLNTGESTANNFQLKPSIATTTKQVLIVQNTNNSNIQPLQNTNTTTNTTESMSIMPINSSNNSNNLNILSSSTVKPSKSPQQTVQYYLSNNFNSNNTNNNIINIQNTNVVTDTNKTVTLIPSINTNTLSLPVQHHHQQQQIQSISSLNNNINNNSIEKNKPCANFVDSNNTNNITTMSINMNNTGVTANTDISNEKLTKAGKPKAQAGRKAKNPNQQIAKVKDIGQQQQHPYQQPHTEQQQPQQQKTKQNEFENKTNVINQHQSSLATDENVDLILNSFILPDTRIFASLLSKDFNNNKNIMPNLTFPEPTNTTNPLNELAYKTLIIGNSEHIILDNPNNLSDFRGSYEKLKNVAIALANKLNKPVSVPAFLLIDSEEALEDVRETLGQKQINPIIIETTNSLTYNGNNANEVIQNTKTTPNTPSSASKKRPAKPKAEDQSVLNGQQAGPPAKKRASNKKSQQNNTIASFNSENNQTQNISTPANTSCLDTSSSSSSFDVNQKLEQIKRENKLVYTNVNSETNAQVESIINNIKSSLIASQNQINSNSNNQYNQVNLNSNNMAANSDMNSTTNNKNISINQSSSNINDVDLNCYSLDSNSLFNLNLNNIEWIA